MNRSTTHTQAPAAVPTHSEELTRVPAQTFHRPQVVEQETEDFILCCFHNQQPSMQVIRSTSERIPDWHLERVLFPGQRLMFYAPPQAQLKIYNADHTGTLLSDTISCDRFQVDES
jgi:hypothetical protein